MACPICDDTAWKRIEVDGVSRVARCDCWYQRLSKSLLDNARVPRGYAHCELSNFSQNTDSLREAHRKATRLVEQFPVVERGLLFFGEQGVGKTHLAVALMKEIIRRKGAQAVFYETRDLLKLVRDTYNTQAASTEMNVLRPVLESDLLVLDDLGAEKKSEWVEETLGLVVNTRYAERRTTVFTTNLVDVTDNTEPRSFILQLGPRIRSRLFEMCDWVKMEGVDVREVGPHPTPEDIARWQERSPASPKNRRGNLPTRTTGQARAQLKPRDRDVKADLKWPGGRAGS